MRCCRKATCSSARRRPPTSRPGLFTVVDRDARIYQAIERPRDRLPILPQVPGAERVREFAASPGRFAPADHSTRLSIAKCWRTSPRPACWSIRADHRQPVGNRRPLSAASRRPHDHRCGRNRASGIAASS